MAIDPASFKIRFSEFACESDTKIQMFIDDSVIVLNETYWGEKYDLGLYYLTAHYLYISNKEGAGSGAGSGPIASKAVDGVSVSYAITASDDDWKNYLSSTSYGKRYLALLKTLGIPASVI